MHRRDTAIYRRGRKISEGKAGDGPVIYWMSRDQRVHDNWSLLWAQQEAIIHDRELLVVFCLAPDNPGASPAQFTFNAAGLHSIASELDSLSIGFLCLENEPVTGISKLVHQVDGHSLVTDLNPLRHDRVWKGALGQQLSTSIYEVDSHNIIPVWITSNKREYAAYTIRPKINRLLGDYLTDIPKLKSHPHRFSTSFYPDYDFWSVPKLPSIQNSSLAKITSGVGMALAAAEKFIAGGLKEYGETRNDPCIDGQSNLSPYLHSGQLSAQRLAWMVKNSPFPEETTAPFLEELIVRRELSDNFCFYEESYDNIESFSPWALQTLQQHWEDPREYNYSFETLAEGKTHEPLWNCCQLDLVHSGKLHGFLRMYWAKKILEWTKNPETALNYANRLNDTYSIDGHDPNGYTGVAWSIGGVHDRAWGERPIFGKIRYMNEKGCRRKFDVTKYMAGVLGKVS